MERRPKARTNPKVERRPKLSKEPEERRIPKAPLIRGGLLTWRFSEADKNGPFSWSNLGTNYRDVLEKLHAYETMTEQEIKNGGSHPISIDNLCKEARDRLVEIKLDDAGELMSFRLKGKERVWCRMFGSVMHVLWWDPQHQVCPSPKKHT